MCGILVVWKPQSPDLKPRFKKALDLQSHRGPDSIDTFFSDSVWLGHNRLAILDLTERGKQPFADPSGLFHIVYNGEVYNYIELKKELMALGYDFRTGTDTEVVLTAYMAWGEDCFNRMNGMWALVIWDGAKKKLVLSRDRFGIKPLFYARIGESWIFSSEIKPILEFRGTSVQPEMDSVVRFLTAGNIDGSELTMFEGIRRFPSSSVFTLDLNGNSLKQTRFWEFPSGIRPVSQASYENFDSILRDAVKISFRSDVPVGICLSGGIDSSLIAATAAAEGLDFSSFTARHQDPDSDEYQYVEVLRQKLGFEAFQCFPESSETISDLMKICWFLEEPAKASGVLSQWNVMKLAKGKAKVLIDGQGGDEVFGGYSFHKWAFWIGMLKNYDLRSFMREVNSPGQPAFARSFIERKVLPLKWRLYDAINLALGRNQQNSIWTPGFQNMQAEMLRSEMGSPAGLHNRLKQDIESETLPALLRYEDRLSMAFSIESRVPLLDYRLVEYAFSAKDTDLISRGWSKFPLRKKLADSGIGEVAWRPDKKGFPTPINSYLQNHKSMLKTWLKKGSLADRDLLRPDAIDHFVDEVIAQKDGRHLWHVLQTELWFRNFVDGDFKAPLNIGS